MLVGLLVELGAIVAKGDSISQPFLSVPGQQIIVKRKAVQEFTYECPEAAQADADIFKITDGILRAQFRNNWEQPELMVPGRIYPIEIQLYPTSNLFVHGHRIRLDISSSNFPRLDVNGNTGENPAYSPIKIVAHNSVYPPSMPPKRYCQ